MTGVEANDIVVRNLVKSFGETQALRGIDLTIRQGEFMTLLGPSGSGKTTLLNMLQGFERPNSGDILLGDRSIAHMTADRRGFGMVFQSYALFPHMTVAENVGYPLRLRGLRRRDRAETVVEALSQVELDGYGDRFPAQLSGGQQQRVALARAIVFKPSVLLMDEPLAALDRRLRQALQYEIKRLHQRISATILYVTHDQEEALVMSDRISVMNQGRIVQVGTPSEVYQHPATQFVAAFLGETNLMEGRLIRESDRVTVLQLSGGGVVRLEGVGGPTGDAVVSIRPEDVTLRAAVNSEGGGLQTDVTSAVYLGDSWRFECSTKAGKTIICRQQAHETAYPEGTQVAVAVRPGKAVVFPAQELPAQ